MFSGDNYAGNANTSRLQLRLFPRRSPSSTPICANVNSRLLYSKATWGKQRKRSSQEQTCKSTETEMKRIPQSSSAYQSETSSGKKNLTTPECRAEAKWNELGCRNHHRNRLLEPKSRAREMATDIGWCKKLVHGKKTSHRKKKKHRKEQASTVILDIEINNADHHSQKAKKHTFFLSLSISLSRSLARSLFVSLARAHGACLFVGSSS